MNSFKYYCILKFLERNIDIDKCTFVKCQVIWREKYFNDMQYTRTCQVCVLYAIRSWSFWHTYSRDSKRENIKGWVELTRKGKQFFITNPEITLKSELQSNSIENVAHHGSFYSLFVWILQLWVQKRIKFVH